MSEIKNRESGTKARRNRPDAPIYMPPHIRNTQISSTTSTVKENQSFRRTSKSYEHGSAKSSIKPVQLSCPFHKEDKTRSNFEIQPVSKYSSKIINHSDCLLNETNTTNLIVSTDNDLDGIVIESINLDDSYEKSSMTEACMLREKLNTISIDSDLVIIENSVNSEENTFKFEQVDEKSTIKDVIHLTEETKETFNNNNISSENNSVPDYSVKTTSVDIQNSKNNKHKADEREINIVPCDNKENTIFKISDNDIKVNKEDEIYSLLTKKSDKETDEDVEEFLRASEGLNRCNKRLVKNSLNKSDVLIIDDSGLSEEKVDDWEELLDDSKFLDSSIFSKINKSSYDVLTYPCKDDNQDCKHRCIDTTMTHIIEIYGFPTEFQTRDLLTIFEHYRSDTYHIKWVDDNHALAIFASESIAHDVLKIQHPLIKLRPMSEASKQAITKAKKNPNAMLPVMTRPQTCPQTARRMVTGALGLKLRSSKEDREKEKQILKEAREKKRLAIKQQDDAWEGRISSLS